MQRSADGAAVWQALDDTHDPPLGRSLRGGTGPGAVDVDVVRASMLPAGPATWFTLAPDDTFVALHGANVDRERSCSRP